jgi:hypothetical protein
MKKSFYILILFAFLFLQKNYAQDYYFKEYQPFDKNIPSPEEFLGYPIGEYHTRHDLVVAYMEKLAELSDKASISVYGHTNEKRKLLILTISSGNNLKNLEELKRKHLKIVDPNNNVTNYNDVPVFIELGYGVHGNEPSSTEAAMLTAYTLLASENPKIKEYLDKTVIFIDPTINPDGRDRFTNWANNFRSKQLISDKYDIEHNEGWPRGRTNHYWFDLNRDLLLAVQPESIARLKWYHEWYPNVVTDFHEMGTNSTYFFEPKNMSASLNPVTPDENYSVLTMLFAKQFAEDLNRIGSQYFYGERYDATYPGYGSTYMDLQGSLALLFEQASSRGHVQETTTGEIAFPFTIRNQFVSGFATIKAAIKHKDVLYKYQNEFFKKAIDQGAKNKQSGYVFGDNYDKNRNKAFVDLLLKHKIKVYPLENDLKTGKYSFKKGFAYVVPAKQKEYLMVRTMFETYDKYRDSVFYDASAWSVANFYNMKYTSYNKSVSKGAELTPGNNQVFTESLSKAAYAYLISWDDYYAPAVLNELLKKDLIVKTSARDFRITANGKNTGFNRGTLMISVTGQKLSADEIFKAVSDISGKYNIQAYAVNSGYTIKGNGLGSNSFKYIKQPRVMMLVEGGVSSYEAGEVWHLFDQRMQMDLTKVPERLFSRVDLNRYNVIIMVSGSYSSLSEASRKKLKSWISAGNTLITSRTATSWVIRNKIVNEQMISKKKDSTVERLNYEDAYGTIGKQSIGGAIFQVDLDLTHPLGFGFHDRKLPVYKNNTIFLKPGKSRFSTVAKYTKSPHIDGFVTQENLNVIKNAASILVSGVGRGRVVMFADNPNFRGAWYGTNKLFMNAVFFGSFISVPK